jgi:hypothetical protein
VRWILSLVGGRFAAGEQCSPFRPDLPVSLRRNPRAVHSYRDLPDWNLTIHADHPKPYVWASQNDRLRQSELVRCL